MDLNIGELMRMDYAIAALAGALAMFIVERVLKRLRRTRFQRRKRLAAPSRVLLLVGFLALAFSAWQYYWYCSVVWPMDGFYAIRDTVISRSLPVSTAPRGLEAIDSLRGRVSSVIDGDSLELRGADSTRYEIRLHGVDTPEWNQPYGDNAERALSRKLRNRIVTVEAQDIDSYGRLVGTVLYDGENINLQMIREGHGWWYREYARGEQELARAEEAAREAGLGLWRQPEPIPPWEWRRR